VVTELVREAYRFIEDFEEDRRRDFETGYPSIARPRTSGRSRTDA
jgi:hypothetical protein